MTDTASIKGSDRPAPVENDGYTSEQVDVTNDELQVERLAWTLNHSFPGAHRYDNSQSMHVMAPCDDQVVKLEDYRALQAELRQVKEIARAAWATFVHIAENADDPASRRIALAAAQAIRVSGQG